MTDYVVVESFRDGTGADWADVDAAKRKARAALGGGTPEPDNGTLELRSKEEQEDA